ncbi:MAG: DUF2334 domain-containing protein [bacterium]
MKLERIQHREAYKRLAARWQKHGFAATLAELVEEAHTNHQRPISFFFRDDDADELTPNLVHLLEVFVGKEIPLHLQVIPREVTQEAVDYLRELKQRHPHLVFLSQHGWSHENHSRNGKKQEFGDARTQIDQFLDIVAGKDKMSELFLQDFFPAFTPPWNRYDRSTLMSLRELGFEVLSADGGHIGLTDFELVEISTVVDLHHCRPAPEMKAPGHLLFEIQAALRTKSTVGVLLHHHEMQATDFGFVGWILTLLKTVSGVEFPNFEQICQRHAGLKER